MFYMRKDVYNAELRHHYSVIESNERTSETMGCDLEGFVLVPHYLVPIDMLGSRRRITNANLGSCTHLLAEQTERSKGTGDRGRSQKQADMEKKQRKKKLTSGNFIRHTVIMIVVKFRKGSGSLQLNSFMTALRKDFRYRQADRRAPTAKNDDMGDENRTSFEEI
ncbi:hypothetical protein Tco_1023958, partial [Tanacetum coccineum]